MATTTTNEQPPTVLIVGAGLGGVMLGALLEKANVPYTILERASTVRSLGAALSIGGTLLVLLEQLQILSEFVSLAKCYTQSTVRNESGETLSTTNYVPLQTLTGYRGYVITRPAFYNLLLKQIPAHKIHFGKRILNVNEVKDDEDNDKVRIQASDGTIYQGDILVGADGAYSAVRQRLYERLKLEGTLPKNDEEDLPFTCTCLVGQTEPLDLEEFPELKDPESLMITTMGTEKPYSWVVFGTGNGSVCFMVLHHLDRTTSRAAQEQRFRNSENSEWGPHAAQSMCDETRGFSIPIGIGMKTLGDLYDRTPKDLFSKVMLEEKVFTTWFSGRTVLLGDACHKLHPAGGQGAMTAMHDAIALANLIYALPSNSSSKDIQQMFTEYVDERLPIVTDAYSSSRTLARALERGWGGAMARWISGLIPTWLWKVFWAKVAVRRFQLGYLPLVPVKDGAVLPQVSPSMEKARTIYEGRKGASASLTAVW